MPQAENGLKFCPGCSTTYPVSEFWKNARNRDGLQSKCKPCHGSMSNAPLQGPNRERYLRYRKNGHLKKTYNIDIDHYDELCVNGCWICGVVPEQGERRLAVDHDHSCCPGITSCGKCVRGVLCTRCNMAIGAFGDDPERIELALAYLRLFKS